MRDYDMVRCKYQGDDFDGVQCPRSERGKLCDKCGWNPAVEYARIKKIKERMKEDART